MVNIPNREVAGDMVNAIEANNQLLVGINYDKQTKQHTCRIESTRK